MVNNMNEVISYISFYEQYDSLNIDKNIDNLINQETLDVNSKSDLKFYVNESLKKLNVMLNLLEEIRTTISSELYQTLSNQISSTKTAVKDMNDILNSNQEITSEIMNNLQNIQKSYKTSLGYMDRPVRSSYKTFEDTLYSRIKNGEIPLTYLETLKSNKNLTSEQINIINRVNNDIVLERRNEQQLNQQQNQNDVKKEQENDNGNIDNAEQPAIEEEKGNEEQEVTLYDKISKVEADYFSGESYSDKLNEVRQEHDLEQIKKELEDLTAKREKDGKLSIKDSFRLYYLNEQKLKLEQKEFDLGKITSLGDKITSHYGNEVVSQNDKLEELNTKMEFAESNLEKFVIKLQTKHTEKKIKKLKNKLGTFEGVQQSLTGIRYNHQMKKMSRSSNFTALKRVASEKRNEFISNVSKDFEYLSVIVKKVDVPARIARLRQKPGTLIHTSTLDIDLQAQDQIVR